MEKKLDLAKKNVFQKDKTNFKNGSDSLPVYSVFPMVNHVLEIILRLI